MNKGFQLYIQKDLTEDDRQLVVDYLENKFLVPTLKHPKMNYFGGTGGGYTSGLWSGRYGMELGIYSEYKALSKPVVFRRISKNTRKFAAVYADTLVIKNDKHLDKAHSKYREIQPDGEIPKMCQCARHKGSLVVDWKVKPELELYKQIGEYKG